MSSGPGTVVCCLLFTIVRIAQIKCSYFSISLFEKLNIPLKCTQISGKPTLLLMGARQCTICMQSYQ